MLVYMTYTLDNMYQIKNWILWAYIMNPFNGLIIMVLILLKDEKEIISRFSKLSDMIPVSMF